MHLLLKIDPFFFSESVCSIELFDLVVKLLLFCGPIAFVVGLSRLEFFEDIQYFSVLV